MFRELLCFCILDGITVITCNIDDCHGDPVFHPEEGLLLSPHFNWLGTLQYIHVEEGTPHYYWVPRVSLISRQFVLATAKDAAQVPDGYALGNVVFGDYERDERECMVTIKELAGGKSCDPAILTTPIQDVLLHPEYTDLGIKSSIALLKLLSPIQSKYMLPVCLPLMNFLQKIGELDQGVLIHIDYASEAPRDFMDEQKFVKYLVILDNEYCLVQDNVKNGSKLSENRYICSNGCDLQTGSPTLIHDHTGHWTIVALAEGGSPCPDPLRAHIQLPPSRHILLHPYVSWITNTIYGSPARKFLLDDPFGYGNEGRVTAHQKRSVGWVGRWWMGGIRCFDRGDGATDMHRFYFEELVVHPHRTEDTITYYLELYSAYKFKIVCVKVGMPYQILSPTMWGLNTIKVKLRIPLYTFIDKYTIIVEAWYVNGTGADEVGTEVYDEVVGGDDYEESTEHSDNDTVVEYTYHEE